jgi:hypothetical protein
MGDRLEPGHDASGLTEVRTSRDVGLRIRLRGR